MPETRLHAIIVFICLAALAGCRRSSEDSGTADQGSASTKDQTVSLVKPERATLRHIVREPGRVQAYEQTPIYPKITGYVLKWHVDINDFVTEKQVLAELYVPEMDEELKLKEKTVIQMEKAREVANKKVATAAALIKEVEAMLKRAEANYAFWQGQYDRIATLTRSVVTVQVKDENWNQLQAAAAGWKQAEAKVVTAKKALEEAKAVRDKAQADIPVTEFDRRRFAALVNYKFLTAPVWKEPKSKATRGVITRRNINTGDFVQPPAAGKGEPLYVVERRDIMRIFVDVPETDAAWVKKGSPARIFVEALQGQEFTGEVVRTSYALDRTARTLTAEIDLPNADDRLRPNMYVLAAITAEHANVWSLPASAVVTEGEITKGYESYCFVIDAKSRARRIALKIGIHAGERVQVLKKRAQTDHRPELGQWLDITGAEQVASDAKSLRDGQRVIAR